MDKKTLLQIMSLITDFGAGMAPGNHPGLAQMNQSLGETARGALQAETIKEEREAQEKAKKGKKWGSIGAAAGALLAVPTGGASLAMSAGMGAAGSAAGGAAGELLSTGRTSMGSVAQYGATGAVAGGVAHAGAGAVGAAKAGAAPMTVPSAVPGASALNMGLQTSHAAAAQGAGAFKTNMAAGGLTGALSATKPGQMATGQGGPGGFWTRMADRFKTNTKNIKRGQKMFGGAVSLVPERDEEGHLKLRW